jgi:hypothetical protein
MMEMGSLRAALWDEEDTAGVNHDGHDLTDQIAEDQATPSVEGLRRRRSVISCQQTDTVLIGRLAYSGGSNPPGSPLPLDADRQRRSPANARRSQCPPARERRGAQRGPRNGVGK